jgi:hypothetical protein
VYVVVSYSRASGHVIRPGLSLVQAYHLVGRLGHGAIYRVQGMSVYARPVYPRTPCDVADDFRSQGRVA